MNIKFEVFDEEQVIETGTMTLTDAFIAQFASIQEAVTYAIDNHMYTLDGERGEQSNANYIG